MYLFPAYGAVYETSEEAIKAWKGGTDFRAHGNGYCSIRDLEMIKNECSTLWIYWNRVDCVRVI